MVHGDTLSACSAAVRPPCQRPDTQARSFNKAITLGNLGKAIIANLAVRRQSESSVPLFSDFIACVRTEQSRKALEDQFAEHHSGGRFRVTTGENVRALECSDVVILAVDPADVEHVLSEPGCREALRGKLLISVAAGWSRQKLETALYGSPTTAENSGDGSRAYILRALPNIAALAGQGLTAMEISDPPLPESHLRLADAIFQSVGKTAHTPPHLMDATTAVAGSTPAFFSIICDALIDASVAVGMPRELARTMIVQSMQGTASMLQGGLSTAQVRDQGTSAEGCTIGGIMVLEEGAVRGHVGRALREAVTIARQMGHVQHVNDTRH
ncbi:Pyrroline-5-carboxylate reductase-like protein [Hapsidospora chrysogenum ATCC 11550]|uniref:Pyrroline-5-carboxylate reductase-like protein n=1 Tax=Hapsidospora chrysogenum (strain ATCC 11550 / CBS 779.69 / DSM 880 / IAM 14645 / JCM 23072 / IMI 49137) TaxID=857340 RepID=A0A086TDM9_HAPC1|nr:Pyrroline-5-carboxylate reductase-like protein [Hapsidospora chrysogenum ATCC 11550]